ncbi:MAG: hypothetical protein R2910_12390 [Gemmatimonadales bacterium]
MPPLTRWFVRSALLWFLLALATGVLLAGGVSAQVPGTTWTLPYPTYLHLLTVGWLTNLIFGVAFWMFPRYTAEHPRGSDRLGWLAYTGLNAGLLLRLVGEPIQMSGGGSGTLLLLSAGLQLLGAWAFVLNTWPRVKVK